MIRILILSLLLVGCQDSQLPPGHRCITPAELADKQAMRKLLETGTVRASRLSGCETRLICPIWHYSDTDEWECPNGTCD